MKNRLEIKILLLLILVLVIGFGSYVIISINRESDVLLQQQKEKAKLFSETVMVGIRNVMLSGKAPYAAELVSDARENLKFGTLRVYNNKAQEVFPDEGRGIISNAGDEFVKKSLELRGEVEYITKGDSVTPLYVRVEPLKNEKECQQCHGENHSIRGVTRLALNPELMVMHSHDMEIHDFSRAETFIAEIISNTLAVGFKNIMVAGQGELMDTLVRRASRLPFIERVNVYDRFGAVHFGDEENMVEPDSVTQAIELQQPRLLWEKNGKILTRHIPLKNEDRCQVCHGQKSMWRGVMEVSLKVDRLKMDPDQLERQLTQMLQSVIGVGFRSIMLVGKGSYVRSFINDVRTISAVKDLRVFDKDANERFVNLQTKDYGIDFVSKHYKKIQL